VRFGGKTWCSPSPTPACRVLAKTSPTPACQVLANYSAVVESSVQRRKSMSKKLFCMLATNPVLTENQVASLLMSATRVNNPQSSSRESLFSHYEVRGLTALACAVLAASAALLFLTAAGAAEPLLVTIMAVLAMLGAFFLFGLASGHIRIGSRFPEQDIARLVTDDAQEAMQLMRPDGGLSWCNKTGARLLGGAPLLEVADIETALGGTPAVSEAMFRLMRAAEAGQSHKEVVPAHLSSDALGPHGDVKWAEVSVSPFTFPGDGGATEEPQVLWRIRDVTGEQAVQEQALSSLHATLAGYNSVPVGLATVHADGALGHVNHTLSTWLGFGEPAELLSRGLKLSDLVTADGAELLIGLTRQEGKEASSCEFDLVREDGCLLPVRIIAQPAADGAGGLILAAVERDTDDLEDADPEIAGTRFQRFFRSAPLGIATIGRDGQIISANTSFSRMIVDGTAKAKPALEILSRSVDADTRAAIAAGLDKVIEGKGNIQPVEIMVGPKGEYTRRLYMSPLTHARNAPEAAIIYLIDVTEQKALEARYAQSQKMEAVGKLAGFVAHDFNNMLTAIIGFSDFLLQTHRPGDPAHSDIINIKSSANRAAGLVGKLLALARQQTLLVEPLQLGEVMTDLAPLLKRSIGERIELKIHSGRDLWFVKTDKLQLEQAIINLAVNARDAMPEGGRLSIRTRNVTERESQKLSPSGMEPGEYVMIEVEDSGSGMSPEVLENIFEPFFTTKAPGKGTGLGLATVYGIVKQTGGFIYPESTVGKGTTFRIYLPHHHLDEKDEAAIAERVEATEKVKKVDLTGHGRVLLVEDEDVVRSFAVRALKRQGYEVLEASDGLDALEVMKECNGEVDIVVSDVVMPGMDGPTMLKELRKTNPDLKIIFVSGYPNEAFQQALGEETFAFLPKPFSLPQLAAKVKEQLGR
jgi:two-component system, cell cycle sensor histidine kinase and response regulator CckA